MIAGWVGLSEILVEIPVIDVTTYALLIIELHCG
jgi:hypothetical protein